MRSRRMDLVLLLLLPCLALMLAGCGPQCELAGIEPGMSINEVKAIHPDLQPASKVLKKKSASIPNRSEKQMLWRFPNNANETVFEAYGFHDGTLSLFMVGYGKDVDFDALVEELKASNGSPDIGANMGDA